MSIILDPKRSLVAIQIHYLEEKSPEGFIKFSFPENREEWQKPNTHELNTTWSRITWEEHNNVMSQCMRPTLGQNEVVRYETDYLIYKQLKMNACLKSWDAKNDDGTDLLLTPEVISSLAPEVADYLLKKFEEITEPNKEDLEKLERAVGAFFDGDSNGVDAAERAWVNEHILCWSYKALPKAVRKLDYTDFLMHLRMCLSRVNIEREFELNLQGVDTKNKTPSAAQPPQRPVPRKGGGAHKTKKVSKVMSFNKKGGIY